MFYLKVNTNQQNLLYYQPVNVTYKKMPHKNGLLVRYFHHNERRISSC